MWMVDGNVDQNIAFSTENVRSVRHFFSLRRGKLDHHVTGANVPM